MLPLPVVAAMLASMAAVNHLVTVQAVAGAGVATGLTNPSLLGRIVSAPFRLANAPFDYLLGGAATDRAVRRLQAELLTSGEGQAAFITALREMGLDFDALRVCLSPLEKSKILLTRFILS